uniref:Natural cytotoxicity triggering receptor 3 n=1 Tax=Chrysemys picta bellii TaxID=8478 RepID=A0A8C3IEP2_CHRPI
QLTPGDLTLSPSEVGVIRGDNATLNCTFSRGLSPDKGAVSWSRGGPGGEAAVPLRARFTLAYPDTFLHRGEGTLAITNVSLEDAGKYVCRVLLWGTGEARGNGTQLRVYGKGPCLSPSGKAPGLLLPHCGQLLSIPPPDSPGNPSAHCFPGTVCRNQDMNPGVLAKCHLTTPCSMAVRLFPSCPVPEVAASWRRAHPLCCVGC